MRREPRDTNTTAGLWARRLGQKEIEMLIQFLSVQSPFHLVQNLQIKSQNVVIIKEEWYQLVIKLSGFTVANTELCSNGLQLAWKNKLLLH